MANNFRKLSPTRTCTRTYANYRGYKEYLVEDFNNRCGYTDCHDFWFGGKGNFHIDHFKPWKKYPALKTSYSNLVYACSYVNIAKSDDDGDYLDPCDNDFNQHFQRDIIGNIIPVKTSRHANYMYRRLKLYLRRYQIIWMLDTLREKMKAIQKVIETLPDGENKKELKATNGELSALLLNYLDYLEATQ